MPEVNHETSGSSPEQPDIHQESKDTRTTPLQVKLALPLATGLGSGFLPISGTAGTLAIFILHFFFFPAFFENPFTLGPIAIVLLCTVVGIWSASVAEKHYRRKDDGRVVIDEWAGYLITVCGLPGTWQWLVAAFFVFRFFDIVKPPPANALQKLKGGWGIMIDDIIAGAYGCILLNAVNYMLILSENTL